MVIRNALSLSLSLSLSQTHARMHTLTHTHTLTEPFPCAAHSSHDCHSVSCIESPDLHPCVRTSVSPHALHPQQQLQQLAINSDTQHGLYARSELQLATKSEPEPNMHRIMLINMIMMTMKKQ